jgi:serine/threonine protein phosphatase 1
MVIHFLKSILQMGVRPGQQSRTVSLEQARVPDDHRAYVIGDIHARADLLVELLEMIAADAQNAPSNRQIIFLGDFVDRGHQSRQVIEITLKTNLPAFKRITLMGNHEEYMVGFMDEPLSASEWLQYGGDATLLSYGVAMDPGVLTPQKLLKASDELCQSVPPAHRQFLSDLQDTYVLGDYMFVHAGIDPKRRLDKQKTEDLRWIRDPFIAHTELYEKIIVHGHTITETPEFHSNRISLDTGAYHSGRLTCLILEGNDRRIIQTGGR